MDNNNIILADEDELGHGYMVSKSKLGEVYVQFWTKTDKRYVKYYDIYKFIEHSKKFVVSGLVNYSENHIAFRKMHEAVIENEQKIINI
jgi:hypothetical protein